MPTALKPVEISRVGPGVDGRGRVWDITAEMLSQVAESYSPELHEAPILINHDHSQPNKGLFAELFFDGEVLTGIPKNVEPEFAEQVNTRRWPKLSAGFYPPDDPRNPVRGLWGLQEVSAVQKAGVKGLKPPEFGEGEPNSMVVFSEPLDSTELGGEEVTDPVDDKPVEPTAGTDPPQSIDALRSQLEEEYAAKERALEERSQSLEEKELSLAGREAALAGQEAARAQEAIATFMEAQVADGFPPFLVPHATVALGAVQGSEPVTFGEGDETLTPEDAIKAMIKGTRLDGVRFGEGEIAGGDTAPKDRTADGIADRARKLMADDSDLGPVEAVARATGG